MVKRIGLYPRVHADTSGDGVVSQAGGVALVETVRVAGWTGCCQRRCRGGAGRWRSMTRRR